MNFAIPIICFVFIQIIKFKDKKVIKSIIRESKIKFLFLCVFPELLVISTVGILYLCTRDYSLSLRYAFPVAVLALLVNRNILNIKSENFRKKRKKLTKKQLLLVIILPCLATIVIYNIISMTVIPAIIYKN